jgi:hypothetical protein
MSRIIDCFDEKGYPAKYKTYIYGSKKDINKEGLLRCKIHMNIDEAMEYVGWATPLGFNILVKPFKKIR